MRGNRILVGLATAAVVVSALTGCGQKSCSASGALPDPSLAMVQAKGGGGGGGHASSGGHASGAGESAGHSSTESSSHSTTPFWIFSSGGSGGDCKK